MSIIESSFTTTGQTSAVRRITIGRRLILQLYGTWTGTISLDVAKDGSGPFTSAGTYTTNGTTTYEVPADYPYVRLSATTVGSGTVGYRFEETNDVVYLGNLEWDDLRFPAQSVDPTGLTGGAGVDNDDSSFPGTLLFDQTTVEVCAGVAQLPHGWAVGTALRPHIHWAKTTSASGAVVWNFHWRAINRAAAPGAWSDAIVGVDNLSPGDTANAEGITSFGSITLPSLTPSSMIAWKLYRKADAVGDTYGADARLFELDFHYQKDSLGTGAEFIK